MERALKTAGRAGEAKPQGEVHVLVVEDDAAIRHSLRLALPAFGFAMAETVGGEDALAWLEQQRCDLVLLDLNMPGMGGLDACRRMRALHMQLPIVVVTVRSSVEEKILLLDAGADDYVTKPFHMGELAARIRAAVRRRRQAEDEEDVLLAGAFRLDVGRRLLHKRGERIALTPTEFALLHQLMAQRGRPVPHSQLLRAVWGPDYGEEREYLRTYIMQLRRKLEDDPARPVHLLTESYFGYRFEGEATAPNG